MRWKKHERERGLRAVGAGPRGSDLRVDGVKVASVYARFGDWRHTIVGWYFVAGCTDLGIPHKNTCDEPARDEQEAKAQAVAYVRSCISKAAAKPTEPTLPTQGDASHD